MRFKPGHINPSQDQLNNKGFDPKDYGWDPQGELATEFRRCRKRSTAPPTNRFLFPETTAQENGWCLKVAKQQRAKSLPKLEKAARETAAASGAEKAAASRRKEAAAKGAAAKMASVPENGQAEGEPKRGLGKWASDSQLSATAPASRLSAAPPGSRLSAAPPPPDSQLSVAAPSCLSSVLLTELSKATSWPGVNPDLVARVRAQDARIEKCMVEARRFQCYGDRGNKHFRPLGETDATAYANAFMLATSGVPPHKWDPRAVDPPQD